MGEMDASSEETISAYFVFFFTLLAVVLILSKLLHDHQRLASVLPEAGMTLLVGIAAGSLLHWLYGDERIGRARGIEAENAAQEDDTYNVDYRVLVDNVLSFSPNVFFVALLPPIIFNSGYHLRRELFFRHMGPIVLLATVGTLCSTLLVAFFLQFVTLLGLTSNNSSGGEEGGDEAFVPTFTELLTFGALISSTDPVSTLAVFQAKRVDPQLFYLVFGESVLNDAVALVLFETFCKFVQRDNGAGTIAIGVVECILGFVMDAVASPLLGWICAIGSALLFKYIDFGKNKLLELSIYLLIMYTPFLVAEVLGLSGIVTILVTGIAARHYVEPNLTETTQEIADVIFRLSAHLAETSIFLELGLSVIGVTEFLQWKFILWSLLACLLSRACHVYPIAAFFNQSLQRQDKSCRMFGYNLKDGMDGIMKMDFVQTTILPIVKRGDGMMENSIHKNKSDTSSSSKATTVATKLRKPMSGNLELAEHLNDFSHQYQLEEQSQEECSSSAVDSQQNHHNQQQDEENSSQSQSAAAAATTTAASNNDTPPQPPHKLVRSVSNADSVVSLTPIPQRDLKIQPNTAHMLWFSGLRGAVAYACVRSFPDTFRHQREFMSTTMMIVLITVFLMGGATESVLGWLDIEMNVNEDQFMETWKQSEQAPKPGILSYLDKRFVQRYVIRDFSSSSLNDAKIATSGPIIPDKPSANPAVERREGLSGRNSILASSCQDSLTKSKLREDASAHDRDHDIEITESSHYDTLHEMGTSVPPARRRTSLFDYGLKSD